MDKRITKTFLEYKKFAGVVTPLSCEGEFHRGSVFLISWKHEYKWLSSQEKYGLTGVEWFLNPSRALTSEWQ